MQIGYVGLGKMGGNMVRRLLEQGYEVVATDINDQARAQAAESGAHATESLVDLVGCLSGQRVVWLMLPAGPITDGVIVELSSLLSPGDTVINGGNEFFRNSRRHASELDAKGINFLDVGVSGGDEGARNGACMMIGGGSREVFLKHEEVFAHLCAPDAYGFFLGSGAGHYVKMVHNGIEYGMMQAIAEGFDILRSSETYEVDLLDASRVYNRESIISSRLMQWMEEGFREYGTELSAISGSAGSGGAAGMEQSEAKWTDDVAALQNTPDTVIRASIDARVYSQECPNFQAKVINTLRNMFGGHKAGK